MKKRKFPAGLVVTLVVLLGAAGAYSVFNTTVANRTPEENQRILAEESARESAKNNPAPATPAAAPDKDAIRSQIQAGVQKGGAGRGPESAERGAPKAAPGTSIIVPKATPYKPVPNESATPSQWFEKR